MPVLSANNQAFTEFSIAVILVLSVLLSIVLTRSYFRHKSASYIAWSAGLWLFTIAVLEELLFSDGIYSQFMIKVYLALVAILVQFLAIGSLMLAGKRMANRAYYLYSIAATAFLIFTLAISSVGDIITNYVVYGPLPLMTTAASSMVTFPAAVILIVMAALSYKQTHNRKMLSIIAGVIVVSIAGTLYIAKFPSFLYYAEFIGILLLWAGFYSPGRKKVSSSGATS